MRPTVLSVAALILLGSGCSKPAPDAAGTALTEQDDLFLAVCGGRQPCSIQNQLALGHATDGRTLLAVVTRSPKRRPTTERSMAEPITEQPWDRFSAIAEEPAPRECTPWRTWLVSRSAGEGTHAQLLVARCATDDGERPPVVESLGAGEVRTTLTAHADNEEGKPAAGYTVSVETLEFGLEPPRVLRIARRRGHGLPGQPPVADRESSWDWEAFRGRACWRGHGDCSEILPVAHIADDGAYGRGAWRATALGPCTLLIDGTPSHGVAEPSANPTASVRALLADDVLYLEVTDDTFVTQGAVVDAIEVMWSSYEAKPGDHPRVERLTMDGKLTREGVTQQVEVVVAGPTTRRFALKGVWPPDMGSWSLAYVDTDDGRTVRQRIASVPSGNDTGQTVLRVDPQPTCAPRGEVLRVGQATATEGETAIVP